jgi:hypothetical protein
MDDIRSQSRVIVGSKLKHVLMPQMQYAYGESMNTLPSPGASLCRKQMHLNLSRTTSLELMSYTPVKGP